MSNSDLAGVVRPLTIQRWKDGRREQVEDVVAEEIFIRVFLNGSIYGSLVCSPWALEELVAGYLYTDGVISTREDIASMEVREGAVHVKLSAGFAAEDPEIPESDPKESVVPIQPLRASDVVNLVAALDDSSGLFRHTGGVHNAALADGGKILTNCEDVGRHNALDRLIGRCLLQGLSPAGKIIVFSGRVPDEIIRKVVCVGCGAIISVSAPTSMAVETAEAAGVVLIGFARGSRFNIYTHPERIVD